MFTTLLQIIDWSLFILLGIQVLYLLLFAWGARQYQLPRRSIDRLGNRFLVLIPAYKEDQIILETVRAATTQEYPKDRFLIVVISDQMDTQTNETIERYGARVLTINFPNSSKAKALNYAIEQLSTEPFDRIVILDADNLIASDFLKNIDRFCLPEAIALQAHRTAKNNDTDVALLDGVSEEINNTLFRKGHVALGLSSALIGSGMIFQTEWFVQHIKALQTAGEDKELEAILLKERVHIDYIDSIEVYDEKTRQSNSFYNQRRRWLAAQADSFLQSLRTLPSALWNRNWDYLDKNIQWMMLPRVILLGMIALITLLLLLTAPLHSLKWLLLLLINLFTLVSAIPSRYRNYRLIKAIVTLPRLFLLMVANLFRLKGVNQQFIHTHKGESTEHS